MTISLSNTLTRRKEIFEPIDPTHVRMYACGPTVYDRPHIGNARAAVVYDLLYRILKREYKKVTYARNITDVDDKIIAAANVNKENISDLTTRFEKYYEEDVRALNCLPPTISPRATENIAEMIAMIGHLIKEGFAYVVEGHVLFRVNKYSEYGKLSGRSIEDMIAGARVEVAPFKEYPGDFVLWKPSKQGEEFASFDSPWGKGRPGWHIECSAMSKRYLGDTFDIHGGGADLMFPHHENEIAQSVCANHKPFAKYWVHNGFLMVEGEKMSKSLGNFKTVREVIDQGIEGVVIRFLYFTTHYKRPLDFTEKLITDSKKAITKFRSVIRDCKDSKENIDILNALKDDLNTPEVISIMHELAGQNKKEELKFACDFIGLDLIEEELDIPQEILDIAEERQKYKLAKDWKAADMIRNKISNLGYDIEDNSQGYRVVKAKEQKISRQNTL